MAVVWLVLGVVLLLVEMRHLAFYALFAAIGSLAASAVALAVPSAIPLQLVVAVVVALAGVVAVRPAVSRAFPRHLGGHVARGVHGGIVGQEALTLDEVGARHARGHVRMTGERWLAVSGAGATIPAETPVVVTAVEGTTLVVWPVADTNPGLPGAVASGPPNEAGLGPAGPDNMEPRGGFPDGADGRIG
jgi:membrane protein implicated in regulation of membrane protease activity